MTKQKKRKKIEIPERISKLISGLVEQELNKEREYLAREKAKKLKRQSIERENIKNGLVYAKKIWAWAGIFRNTDIGRKLIKVSHTSAAYNWVCFFDGHIEGRPWRGLGISVKKGVCWMRSGCGATPQALESPKDLARVIDTEILKLACEWIDNGKVWECIEERLGYLQLEDLII